MHVAFGVLRMSEGVVKSGASVQSPRHKSADVTGPIIECRKNHRSAAAANFEPRAKGAHLQHLAFYLKIELPSRLRPSHGRAPTMLKALSAAVVITMAGLAFFLVQERRRAPGRKRVDQVYRADDFVATVAQPSTAQPSYNDVDSAGFDEADFLEDAYAALEPGESIPAHELRLRVARRGERDSILALDTADICSMLARDERFAIGPRRYVSLAGLPPRRNPFDFEFDPSIKEMDQAS